MLSVVTDVNQVDVKHSLRLHQFVDDCQVCVTTSIDDVALAVDHLAWCVSDIGKWMSSSRLRLNSSKTQAIWLGHKNHINRVNINSSIPVLSSSVSTVDSICDLGVVIDSRLTMSDHVTALCRSVYYQLRQLRPVVRALPEAAVKTLVHAFVSCRLDYCNALLYGITDTFSSVCSRSRMRQLDC